MPNINKVMDGDKKVILHIICDSIWFDKVYSKFEEMDRYVNRYLYRDIGVDKSQFEYIIHSEKIICAMSLQEWGDIVGDPKIDIIYLQGLWKGTLKAIDYIRKDAVVMWWCFGQEIYGNEYGWAPLLPVKVYKPRTFLFLLRRSKSIRSVLSKSMTWMFPHLYDLMQGWRYRFRGKRRMHQEMLCRIDYTFTPLPFELDEMKLRHPEIKAKPYRLGGGQSRMPFEYHEKIGNILFDHSAMTNNNHFDILPIVKKLNLRGRKVCMPLSYGNQDVADYMMKHASFRGAETQFLQEVLPKNEYLELLSNCSHAIFGTIRQSGVGNINILLRKGVKVFFFEDSVMYKHYKREGYYVFSIEKDLNDESISTLLSYEIARHNYNLFYEKNGVSNDTYQQQFDALLSSNG